MEAAFHAADLSGGCNVRTHQPVAKALNKRAHIIECRDAFGRCALPVDPGSIINDEKPIGPNEAVQQRDGNFDRGHSEHQSDIKAQARAAHGSVVSGAEVASVLNPASLSMFAGRCDERCEGINARDTALKPRCKVDSRPSLAATQVNYGASRPDTCRGKPV